MIAGGAVAAIVVIGGIVWSQMGGAKEQPAAPAPAAPVAAVPVVAPDETLTNEGIIQMVKAKVPMEVIYSQLRTAPNKFSLSAADVIQLTEAGVPLTVIEGMRDPKSIPAVTASKSASVVGTAPATPGAKATGKSSDKAVAPATAVNSPAPTPVAPAATAPPAVPVAEVVTPTPRPAVPSAGTKQVVLPDGSPFAIILAADIPDNAKEGLQLRFTVVGDIKVGDSVVIAKGAVAMGQISQGKGRLVGKMQLRLLTVSGVDGKLYKIRALSSRSNKDQQRPVDTGVKPKNDKSAADAGTQYIAYVDGDMTVAVRGK
jgi:hypothetical protein